jgi:hypothetical protein
MSIPAGMEQKAIHLEAAPADAVVTFAIVRDVAASAGVPTHEAALVFAKAHMALGIKLRSDRATGMGWVTEAEAVALREFMIANV